MTALLVVVKSLRAALVCWELLTSVIWLLVWVLCRWFTNSIFRRFSALLPWSGPTLLVVKSVLDTGWLGKVTGTLIWDTKSLIWVPKKNRLSDTFWTCSVVYIPSMWPETIGVVVAVGKRKELTGTVGKVGICCFWLGTGETGAWNSEARPWGGQAASSLSNPLISNSSAVRKKSCRSCCGTKTSPV